MQVSVPLPVFGKGFLYQFKGVQKICVVRQFNDSTALMKAGNVCASHSDKINVPVFQKRLIHILSLDQVDVPEVWIFPLFIEPYAFQTGAVILGIEGDILIMFCKNVCQDLHIQPEQTVFSIRG